MQVGTVPRNFTYKSYAGYAQDDWRILPQLTLNLGLRYEFTTTINEANGLFGDFSPASASGMVQQGKYSPLYKLDPWAIGPRIGLAWDVTGKSTTVVRAGFNIMYQNPVTQIFFTPGSQIQTMPTGLTMGAGCTTGPSRRVPGRRQRLVERSIWQVTRSLRQLLLCPGLSTRRSSPTTSTLQRLARMSPPVRSVAWRSTSNIPWFSIGTSAYSERSRVTLPWT